MKLILVKKRSGTDHADKTNAEVGESSADKVTIRAPKRTQIRTFGGAKLFAVGALVTVVLPLAMGAGSYWLASKVDRTLNPYVDPEYRIAVEARVSEQEQELSATREFVRNNLDALGSHIGSLQAQVSRINAVEMRLADIAGLDLKEFQFNQDPPIGGADAGDEESSDRVDIENAIALIERELAQREAEISTVDFLITHNNVQSQQTPTGWPVENGWISSSFGSRMHPMTGKKHFHRGVDIPGEAGSAVRAVADGVVRRSLKNGGYGWMVELDHGDGYTTLYSHNNMNFVTEGQIVHKGQQIAEIGSTGRATGPHVHFEVLKEGKNINPIKYLHKKDKLLAQKK